MTRWMLGVLFLVCAGCGGAAPSFMLGEQAWNDVSVAIEARQSPADPAIYEFLMVASNFQHRPVHNLTVSIRLQDQEPWKQAIQDGLVGVYRRAYKVADPRVDTLQVHLRRGKEEGILRFALTPLTGVSGSR